MMWCGVVLGPGGWQAYLGAVLQSSEGRRWPRKLDWIGSEARPLH